MPIQTIPTDLSSGTWLASLVPAAPPAPTVSRASGPEEGHSGHCAPQRDPGELHAEVYSSSPPSPLYPLHLLVPILSVLLRLFALFGKYLTFNLNNSSEPIWSHVPTCYFKSHGAITLWWNLVSGERETVGMVICSPRPGQKAWLESCPRYWLSLWCHRGTHYIERAPWKMKGLN